LSRSLRDCCISQRQSAKGIRLEQLQKDLVGEKKLLKKVLWPVLKSFDGIILEYELVSTTGVRIFIDVFYEPLGIAFESEGYCYCLQWGPKASRRVLLKLVEKKMIRPYELDKEGNHAYVLDEKAHQYML
jgi:hypothetical protein